VAAGSDTGTGGNAITDFYGYIIDLAFRTNVAGSNLLLQTAAQNRIYSNNTENEAIMGSGSTMTFTGSDTFKAPNVQKLMKHIRMVFFQPSDGTILAYAALDADTPKEVDGHTVTANIYLCDATGATLNKDQTTAVITALEQNIAKAVSVLVYLDGETITNADVANGTASMTGSVNLQFSSSANLVPMDYADLKQGGGTTSGGTTLENLDTSKVTIDETTADGVSLIGGYVVKSGENVSGIGLRLNGVPADKDVYLTVNEGTPVKATKGSYGGYSGYGIDFTGAVTSIKVTLQDSVSEPDDENGDDNQQTTTYTVTLANDSASGITLSNTTVTEGSCAFSLVDTTEGITYTVTYSMGTTVTDATVAATDGTYTISDITDNVVVKVTANS